jgi:hypothetical protein
MRKYKLHAIDLEIASQWHPTKNGEFRPEDFSHGSRKKVWWKCGKFDDHEWESRIVDRHKQRGCPFCCGQRVALSNCLATIFPKLSQEWHISKNGNLTSRNVIAGSRKKVWWKCSVESDHEWEASIDHRARGRGCPCCAGKKVVLSNCLATTNPELCIEWHSRNQLTPYGITAGSHKKVWWKCNKANNHEWEATVLDRTTGYGTRNSVC